MLQMVLLFLYEFIILEVRKRSEKKRPYPACVQTIVAHWVNQYQNIIVVKLLYKRRGNQMKSKKSKGWLSITLGCLLFFASACSSSNTSSTNPASESPSATGTSGTTNTEPSDKLDPDGKYVEPVTLSIAYQIPNNNKWPEGSEDSYEDNEWTRLIEEKYNLKFTHAFEVQQGDAYNQKINLLISSNDIPDVLMVDQNQLRLLAEADMLEDLTQVYQDYASPDLKGVYDAFKGHSLAMATVNGKLLALPNSNAMHNMDGFVWIREDWLKKVGIELNESITLDDLANVAQAFIEKDPDGNNKKDTFGLQSTELFTFPTSMFNTFDLIFAANHAYPKIWVTDSSGQAVYGSITPEAKTTLGILRDWYASGLLDKEFPTLKLEQFKKDASAGKAGILQGAWWTSYELGDSITNDPQAEWVPYLLVDADGKYNAKQDAPSNVFLAVKKGVKHPEAIVKLLNLYAAVDTHKLPSLYANNPETTWFVRPGHIMLTDKDNILNTYKRLQDAADGKIKRDELPTGDQTTYDAYMKGLEALKKNPGEWGAAVGWYLGAKLITSPAVNEVYSAFYGVTPSMETTWANLQKLEMESYVRIITGDKPLDYFDSFVEDWKKQGGDKVTAEVNAAIK